MGDIEVYDEVFEFWVPGVALTGERENMVGQAKGGVVDHNGQAKI